MFKCYILIDSNYAIENNSGVLYFSEIINKTIPDYNWNIVYTDDIPTDGNVYILLTSAAGIFFNKMVSKKIISIKEVISDTPLLDKNLYFSPFYFEPDSIRDIKEVKKNAWNFIKNTLIKNIAITKTHFDNNTNKHECEPILSDVTVIDNTEINNNKTTEEQPVINTAVDNSEYFNYSYEEFTIDINDIFKTFVDSKIKIKESPLDVFDGIRVYSSLNPDKFITLSNSSKKYDNKMTISELFVILKASLALGADSITYRTVKKNIAA